MPQVSFAAIQTRHSAVSKPSYITHGDVDIHDDDGHAVHCNEVSQQFKGEQSCSEEIVKPAETLSAKW